MKYATHLKSTANPKDRFEETTKVPMTNSNFTRFLKQFHQLKTTEGLQNVTDHRNAICKISTPPEGVLQS
jgi:hypothetical protein